MAYDGGRDTSHPRAETACSKERPLLFTISCHSLHPVLALLQPKHGRVPRPVHELCPARGLWAPQLGVSNPQEAGEQPSQPCLLPPWDVVLGAGPSVDPSPGCGVPHLAPQSTLHSLTHALQLLLRQTAGAMCPRHGRQGEAGGRTAAGSEGTGARAQRGVGPAGQGHGVEPAGVFLCLSEAGLGGSGGPAAAACLGTAGQSLAAFLWGQWALARLIQFLCCQENGISW